jgi:hypothetical protein
MEKKSELSRASVAVSMRRDHLDNLSNGTAVYTFQKCRCWNRVSVI